MGRYVGSLLACCALVLTGCGTVQHLSNSPDRVRPYGGTRMCCHEWFGSSKGQYAAMAGLYFWPFYLVDKPLCVVADTLTLPYTLRASALRSRTELGSPQPGAPPHLQPQSNHTEESDAP